MCKINYFLLFLWFMGFFCSIFDAFICDDKALFAG